MIIKFPGYGVNASDLHIMSERITYFYRVEFNGRHGTRIVLDTGAELTTELMPYEVEYRIKDAETIAKAEQP